MNPIVRNILAVIIGIAVGMVVNMALVMSASSIIPLPEGIDVMDPESIAKFMPQFETKHFIMPFLAHALGTFFGAYAAALVSKSRHMTFAMVIGLFFLIGGVANIMMIPSTPTWFIGVDLALAYLPFAWFAAKLRGR
jgi:hypothetical protein